MKVNVLYFAVARDRADGLDREVLELPDGATVADLLETLEARHPALGRLLPRCRIALDEAFAAPSQPLAEGAEAAVIPPVSGG